MDASSEQSLKPALTLEDLRLEAAIFAAAECEHDEPSIFGSTDGKAVGTYLEHKFVAHLMDKFSFAGGNSALGIDIPSVNVDIKVTSTRQPQSSCSFTSARQKIYGLGYHLIVFVYDKEDHGDTRTSRLTMADTIFIDAEQSADFQTTRGINNLLDNEANEDDLVAFLEERHLPVDELEARNIAKELLVHRPLQGYVTISNALQWRLQFGRALTSAGNVSGIHRIYKHER